MQLVDVYIFNATGSGIRVSTLLGYLCYTLANLIS
mgnify:CR=1 FL=1